MGRSGERQQCNSSVLELVSSRARYVWPAADLPPLAALTHNRHAGRLHACPSAGVEVLATRWWKEHQGCMGGKQGHASGSGSRRAHRNRDAQGWGSYTCRMRGYRCCALGLGSAHPSHRRKSYPCNSPHSARPAKQRVLTVGRALRSLRLGSRLALGGGCGLSGSLAPCFCRLRCEGYLALAGLVGTQQRALRRDRRCRLRSWRRWEGGWGQGRWPSCRGRGSSCAMGCFCCQARSCRRLQAGGLAAMLPACVQEGKGSQG